MSDYKLSSAWKIREATRMLYNPAPDYTRPLLEIPDDVKNVLLGRLEFLYGRKDAERCYPELERMMKVHYAYKPRELAELESGLDHNDRFNEQDMILITYGDMMTGGVGHPLKVLADTCQRYMKAPNTLHILPFYPYSSDRGFSVTDFTSVDPRLGTWDDIKGISSRFSLMFDGVLNHISSKSQLFCEYLNGNPHYNQYFIAYDSPEDLTPDQRGKIFRPRTSDILTKFDTYNGEKYIWTTFSEDQIDLNYRDPSVLLSVVDAMLFYVRMGANLLRLDAVTYIWAEPGTECVHLPQTHEIVKLLRSVLELVAPSVAIITETNVPHKDNISYFGNGHDEAHMVYNFALPTLVLYTLFAEDSTAFTAWARDLAPPNPSTCFFNILDTHDGIGLMGVKGILSPSQIGLVVEKALEHGALISYKTMEGGGEEPYEINSTWWSVLDSGDRGNNIELKVKRYVASRSLSLILKGVPGLYMHGALGSDSDLAAYQETRVKRDVNRSSVNVPALENLRHRKGSKISLLVKHLVPFQMARVSHKAFHPRGAQKVLDVSSQVVAVLRTSPKEDEHILALTNISAGPAEVSIPADDLPFAKGACKDVVSGLEVRAGDDGIRFTMEPYQVLWLKPSAEKGFW